MVNIDDLNRYIDDAIALVEDAISSSDSANVVLDETEIELSAAENLILAMKRYKEDRVVEHALFKAIPIKLCITSTYWRKLQMLINEAYLDDVDI